MQVNQAVAGVTRRAEINFVFVHSGAASAHLLNQDKQRAAERDQFAAGRQVVLYEEGAGTGLCSTYTPAGFVQRVLGKSFRYVSFMPTGASGQDVADSPSGTGRASVSAVPVTRDAAASRSCPPSHCLNIQAPA